METSVDLWDRIVDADQAATLAINGWNSAVTDPFWQFMSEKLVWVPLYVLVMALIFWKAGWRRGLIAAFAIALAVLVGDQLANLVKDTVLRLRPCWDAEMVGGGLNILEKKGGQYGFFSAHATNSFIFASSTSYIFRSVWRAFNRPFYTLFISLWATLVSVSRVFVGKHYLGDVLVGAVVGIVLGIGAFLFARMMVRRLSMLRNGAGRAAPSPSAGSVSL